MKTHRLVVLGAPRTKKNHSQIITLKTGRRFLLPSKQHDEWFKPAIMQVKTLWKGAAIDTPCNLAATFYRERRTGDLGNYLAAACDLLERGGVVTNDRLITQFDGSRLAHDPHEPRIDIVLTELEAHGV